MVTFKCVWCGQSVERVEYNPHGMPCYENDVDCPQSSSGMHDIDYGCD